MTPRTYQTKVLRIGAFWKVQRWLGEWQTMPASYSTRQEARNEQRFWEKR